MNRKILSLLGLCEKAGKLKVGSYQVGEAVRSKKARLVLVAVDASERTKKEYRDMCSFYHIDLYNDGKTEELSRAVGREGKKAYAVTDDGLAASLRKLFAETGMEASNGSER